MSTYRKLLLSNQGGIIDEIHRSEQDNCAVVAIGLGGTGVSCLRNLKAKVFNRVIPDDPDSAVPKYDHIKFLAVDSDDTGLVNSDEATLMFDELNKDNEYLDISYQGDIIKMFKQNAAMLDNNSIYKDWLNHDKIDVASAKTGACGVRQIGRYLFMQKANNFVSKVQNLIKDAKSGLNKPKVYVHIFTGLGGGTGAGTFLDAFYLVKKAIESEGENAFVCGYLFLPDVNLSKVSDDETKSFIQINGYASLQELDYCMNFQVNGDRWSQRYPGVGLVDNNEPPMNICHLISGKNANGDIIPDAYNYAMNVVTDYFMDFVVKTKDFTMESHIANYVARKSQLNRDSGAMYEYCVLGASNAALPYKEVLTYLTSRMFEGFEFINKNYPGKAGVDDFVKQNALGFDAIFNLLRANVDLTYPNPDVKPKDAHANDKLVTDYFADIKAKNENILEKNYQVLAKDLDSFDINYGADTRNQVAGVSASSIITRIFKAIYSVITNPAQGPYYAEQLLNGSSDNLIAVIDGHISEIESKIGQLEINLGKKEDYRQKTQDDFFNNKPSNRNFRNYVEATRTLVIEYTRRVAFYQMKTLLEVLRKQVSDLYTKYVKIYSAVITDLIDTFKANRVYLKDISDNIQTFEYPIATINQLETALDVAIKEIDIPTRMIDFQKYMLDANHYNAWKTKNENEISKLVSHYFINMFNAYTNKTMTDYLKDKYNTDNTDELIHEIRNDIMNQLDIKASPLYWTSVLYSSDNATKIGYVSIPESCEEVVQAAKRLHEAKEELVVRNTCLMDRISVMRCFVGAPIFGYQPIRQYEVNSMNDTQFGKHLYEGRVYTDEKGVITTGRDWRNLPSVVPYSKMNSENSTSLRDIAKHAEEVYLEAEKLGFIVQIGNGEYALRTFDETTINKIDEIANAAIKKGDPVMMVEASNKVSNMLNSPVYAPKTYGIKNDARNGDDELPENEKKAVRIDHFATAPLIVKIAEKQVSEYRRIEALVKSLVPKIDEDFQNFCNALFTGTIVISGNKIFYTDAFGSEILLSAPQMPMGGIRPFQAFDSYKKLDEETKEALKAASDEQNALDVPAEATIAACSNVKALFEPRLRAMMLQIAKKKFPEQAHKILKFIQELEDALEEYMITYGIII